MPFAPKKHRPGTIAGRDVRAPAENRPTAAQRGYGARWQKARARFLLLNPLCRICEEQHGTLTPATCVDHVIPHRGNPVLFWDESNWQPTCDPCHSSKTASEDGGFGNPRKGEGVTNL